MDAKTLFENIAHNYQHATLLVRSMLEHIQLMQQQQQQLMQQQQQQQQLIQQQQQQQQRQEQLDYGKDPNNNNDNMATEKAEVVDAEDIKLEMDSHGRDWQMILPKVEVRVLSRERSSPLGHYQSLLANIEFALAQWRTRLDMLHQASDAQEVDSPTTTLTTTTTFATSANGSGACRYVEHCPPPMQTSSSRTTTTTTTTSPPPTMLASNSLDSSESGFASSDGHQDNANDFYGNINFDNLCAQYAADVDGAANEWEAATSGEVYSFDEKTQTYSQVYFQEFAHPNQQQQQQEQEQQQQPNWSDCLVSQQHYTTTTTTTLPDDHNAGVHYDTYSNSIYYQHHQQENAYPDYSFDPALSIVENGSQHQANEYYQLNPMVSTTTQTTAIATAYHEESDDQALVHTMVSSGSTNVINTIDQLNSLLESAGQPCTAEVAHLTTDYTFDDDHDGLPIKPEAFLPQFNANN